MAAQSATGIRVQVSGDATSFSGEAVTALTANKVYQITNTAKRVWDRSAAITVKNGGTPVNIATDPYTINRLTGTVTFTNTTARTITIDGSYLPMSTLALAKEFSLECMAENPSVNTFDDGADMIRQQLRRDWSATLKRLFSSNTYLYDAYSDAVPVVLALSLDGSTDVWRGWGLIAPRSVDAAVASWIEEGASFVGSADVDGRADSWLI